MTKKFLPHMDDDIFIKEVLGFYDTSGRHDLIWRKKINPYRILVSEIMLQQTQVGRVISKFKQWMDTYPNLEALGRANLQDVLILWQGLGYQRRAKALLLIAKEYKTIPKTYSELLLLPGVGSYTASAVHAFAFDSFSCPVLETNIRTAVIDFYFQHENEIHDGMLLDVLSRLEKTTVVQDLGARHWYYALMDYGANLKSQGISHNKKSAHHTTQSVFKGSLRELRAKTLFAITYNEQLPSDDRLATVIAQLEKESYIQREGDRYVITAM